MKSQQQQISAVERQRQALELRKRGMSYSDIAAAIGYKSPSGAHQAVAHALKKTLREEADGLREMEAERLDALLDAVWDKAMRGNKDAVDRVLRIMERRARLLGLDAQGPTAAISSDGQTLTVVMDR